MRSSAVTSPKEINIQRAEDLARQAAGNGARIICFPELCTTIYFCFGRDRKWIAEAEFCTTICFCFGRDERWFAEAEPIPGPAGGAVKPLDLAGRFGWPDLPAPAAARRCAAAALLDTPTRSYLSGRY